MSSDLLMSTLRPERLQAPAENRLPALTLLYHPQLERIGERALLSDWSPGTALSLSRTEPSFGPSAAPLTDPFISRNPVRISPGDGAWVMTADASAAATAEGHPLGPLGSRFT